MWIILLLILFIAILTFDSTDKVRKKGKGVKLHLERVKENKYGPIRRKMWFMFVLLLFSIWIFKETNQ